MIDLEVIVTNLILLLLISLMALVISATSLGWVGAALFIVGFGLGLLTPRRG